MRKQSPREQRLTLIGSTDAVVARLLAMAGDGRLRDELGLAARGLERARALLNRDDAEWVPTRLRCVDATLAEVTERLVAVVVTLKGRGSDMTTAN